jgi:hypothetical protein
MVTEIRRKKETRPGEPGTKKPPLVEISDGSYAFTLAI